MRRVAWRKQGEMRDSSSNRDEIVMQVWAETPSEQQMAALWSGHLRSDRPVFDQIDCSIHA
jgi:hypothetical protein